MKVDWAEIWFFGGSAYNTHCNQLNRTARIVFVCDQNQGDNVSVNGLWIVISISFFVSTFYKLWPTGGSVTNIKFY